MYISKLDVAKRELEYSIRLFFLSGDPVVLHLTVSASQAILRGLASAKNMPLLIDKMMENIKPDKRKYVRNKLSEPYNFIKHADKDPEKILEFNSESSEYAIWECIDLYLRLTNEITGLMQSFRMFFYIKNVEILIEPENQAIFIDARSNLDINNKNLFLDLAQTLESRRTR